MSQQSQTAFELTQPRGRRALGAISANLLMTLAYAVAGHVGLLLTSIPGFASAIWPPSGIALAGMLIGGGRIWPGILLGSYIVDLYVEYQVAYPVRSAVLAGLLSVAATLQAWVGARLIRRWVDLESALTGAGDVLKFLVAGGPIACLTNSTLGILTLVLGDHMAVHKIPNAWVTWWAGDTIGVVVFAPILLVALHRSWSIERRRILTVATPLITAYLLSLVMFYKFNSYEIARLDEGFQATARRTLERFKFGAQRYEYVLGLMKGVFLADPGLTRARFHALAAPQMALYPGLHALSWNLVVPFAARLAEEAAAGRDGVHGFHFLEFAKDGRVAQAGKRPFYTVVKYVEPSTEHQEIVPGFDLASEAAWRRALDLARGTDQPSTTTVVRPLQTNDTDHDMLAFLPVFADELAGQRPGATSERAVVGYVAALFRTSELVSALFAPILADDMTVTVQDITPGAPSALLYAAGKTAESRPSAALRLVADQTVLSQGEIRWRFTFQPTHAYIASHRAVQSWLVLAIGQLFAGLLGAVLLIITGRTVALTREVAERRNVEKRLEDSHQELMSRNSALEDARCAAEAANQAKSTFLANISHEIRTPLTAMMGFSDLLASQNLPEPSRARFVERIRYNGEHLAVIINDLLDLSSIESGRLAVHRQAVALAEVFADVENLLKAKAEEKGLRLGFKISDEIPRTVHTDPVRLRQILLNIVGNAIKFTETGAVQVTAELRRRDAAPLLAMLVRDTGIGISPAEAEQLFKPFSQIDTSLRRKVGGTGLGLDLSRRLARLLGGDVVLAASQPGQGSTFTITIAS